MGTLNYLSALDDQPGPRRVNRDDVRHELELPGWEEFTAARDRFFANLRAAAELYRHGDLPPEDNDSERVMGPS